MERVFNEILGREVIIPDQPARIVSLSPAITESLFKLDLGERFIGVSAFGIIPESGDQYHYASWLQHLIVDSVSFDHGFLLAV